MKILLFLIIEVSLCGAAMPAQLVNTNTYTFASSFPSVLVFPNYTTYNPDSNACWSAGWRTIASTQSPSNGYSACTPYAISAGTNTWTCSLVLTQQCNIQAGLDAAITNAPDWATFLSNAQRFRTILRAYNGNGVETNYQVTQPVMVLYMNTNKTLISTVSNFNDFVFIYQVCPTFTRYDSNTAAFWLHYGRLIP